MPNPNVGPFVIEAWIGPDKPLEVVATSVNVRVARAAFEAAKSEYSMRLTLRDRMALLDERPDIVTGQKKGQAG